MDRDIIMQALKLVIMVVTLIVTRYVIPYLKAKTENEKFDKVIKVICESVKAAEQIFGDGDGESKKRYAVHFACKILSDAGIRITVNEAEALIEAAVHTMNYDSAMIGILPEAIGEGVQDVTEDE